MIQLACLSILALSVAFTAEAQTMTPEARRSVVIGAADLIEARYVDPERGLTVARELRQDADRFDQTDPTRFAQALTGRLRALSDDGHFSVEHRPGAGTDEDLKAAEDAHGAVSMQRWYGAGVNHGFEAVQRLKGGVGYLDLRVFAPMAMGGDLLTASMTLLAQSPALIIDLRRNGGGMGETVKALTAYLFSDTVEVSGTYDRPTDVRSRGFTPSWVPGRRFGAEKPVYILISRHTFSAAEAFTYDLQALGRVTVVGERSGGGAHPFQYRSITPDFILSLPEGRSINPITGGDWEGVGVRPDVETPPDQALSVALRLALERISPVA